MATHTINDQIINSPEAKEYFMRGDRRVMIGLRATLELLSLPVPEWAERRPPGRTPAKAVLKAFTFDHPLPRKMTPDPRKPDASPEHIALLNSGKPGRGLFDQTFSNQ